MNLENLEKIPKQVWLTIFSLVFPMIFSGSFFIFIFDRGIFNSLDILKLLLISTSGTTPLFLLNTVGILLIIIANDKMSDNKNNSDVKVDEKMDNTSASIFAAILVGSFLVATALYLPMLLNLFISIPLRFAVRISLLIELIFIILFIFGVFNSLKRNKLKNKQ